MPRPEEAAGLLLDRSAEEACGGLLADRALGALHAESELPRGRLSLAQLDLRSGNQPLVVVPMKERAIVLREADDLCTGARLEVGKRHELSVLRLLEVGVDGP